MELGKGSHGRLAGWGIPGGFCGHAMPPGISECVAHGLRKAALRRLAEYGSTSKEIQAISGHKSLAEIERYTEQADQQRLAKAAISKLPDKD